MVYKNPLGWGILLFKCCHPERGKSADFKTNYTLAIIISLSDLIGPEIPAGLSGLKAVFFLRLRWVLGDGAIPPSHSGSMKALEMRQGEAWSRARGLGLTWPSLLSPEPSFQLGYRHSSPVPWRGPRGLSRAVK